MRLEILLEEGEMLVCGSCLKEIRNAKAFIGDLEEQPFLVLCAPCLDLEEDAMAGGKDFVPVHERPKMPGAVCTAPPATCSACCLDCGRAKP
jgi:hypothetical protein